MTTFKHVCFTDIIDYFRMQPKNHEATAADIYAILSRNGEELAFDLKDLRNAMQAMCVDSFALDDSPTPSDFTFLEEVPGDVWHYRMWDVWWDYLNHLELCDNTKGADK